MKREQGSIWGLLLRRAMWPVAGLALVTFTVVVTIDPESLSISKRHGAARLTEASTNPVVVELSSELVKRLPPQCNSSAMTAQGPVQIILRAGGRRLSSAWSDSESWAHGLPEALDSVFEQLASDINPDTVDMLEINLSHSYELIAANRLPDNVDRGIRGIEISTGAMSARLSPTETLAFNLDFPRALARLSTEIDLTATGPARLRAFDTCEFLIQLENLQPARITPMFRGNVLVHPDDVTETRVRHAAEMMAQWLVRQVQDDGRMIYKYWPSNGRESTSNNLIRQFMATIALGRWADSSRDDGLRKLRDKNLAFNMDRFYSTEGDLGYVVYEDKIKLGAVALAALAHVERGDEPENEPRLAAMLRFVDRMWLPNGRFRTWYPRRPSGADSGVNFYPGEALLLWSTLYARNPDPVALERIMASFRYYRSWHRQNPNPAFVPWHTQAYFKLWLCTGDPELRSFIFEMNDWLVEYQQWDSAPYPDVAGRFYDPGRQYFGPPHAASTGAYIEGLVDAFALARHVGDQGRADRYRLAIRRALRSVLQLQFDDEIDMYYVSKKHSVEGGIRTTVYNNEIRVDNVQHNLIALGKLFEHFDTEDF